MAFFLIVENVSLATSYSEVCAALFTNLIVPVTVATTDRSFSKLQLIKNFFQSSMSQERLSDLSLLSVKNERVKNLYFRKIV